MSIQKTLNDHKLWVLTGGKAGMKANLRDVNLYDVDLRDVDLYGADLYGANLYGTDLYGADLREADLRGAKLRGADLRDVDLRGANLCGADLYGARGLLQWQAPQGEKRICYSVKHDDCVIHKLGCFWGATDKAVEAIRNKYGEGSLYEKFLLMQVEALESERTTTKANDCTTR